MSRTLSGIGRFRPWYSVLLLCLSFSPALATVEIPAVVMRGDALHRALEPGEAFSIPVDIYIREGTVLQGVDFRPDAKAPSLSFEPSMAVGRIATPPGYRHVRRVLEGKLESGLDAVRLDVTVDGEVYQETIRLRSSGDMSEGLVEPGAARQVATRRLDPSQFTRPDPVPSGYPVQDAAALRAPRSVNFSGNLYMWVQGAGWGHGVDGATVHVMQVRDILDDIELGSTTTDVNGDWSLDVMVDGTPDLYVKYRAINSVVNIGTDVFFQTWSRNLPVIEDFAGTSHSTGPVAWTGEFNHTMWMLTTITRAHRWYVDQGYVLPRVSIRWWDDVLGSSCYLKIEGMWGIHLRSESAWAADTLVHEYGHHFVATSGAEEVWPPHYTNGQCDPGHCYECPENEAVAWSEGLPYFLEGLINLHHRDTYSFNPPGRRWHEGVGDCRETSAPSHNPQSTEGWLANLLHDIIDSNPDSSALAPGVTENSDLDLADVLNVATAGGFSNSLGFVEAFRSYLGGPAFSDFDRREFWAATAVNGFASDGVAPTLPTDILVPTHPLGVSSPSNLPVMEFVGATDDESGVYLYRVEIAASPMMPGAGALETPESELTWPTPLTPGPWHINVSVVDRAGNVSASFATRPIIVDLSTPVNLAEFTPPLWDDSFLLRSDTTVTEFIGLVQDPLPANTDLWMSHSARNDSPAGLGIAGMHTRIRIDGQLHEDVFFDDALITGFEEYPVLNSGPVQLVGGRHHFDIRLDDYQVVAEDIETDNFIDRYVIIQPPVLAAGGWQVFPEPPRAMTARIGASQPYPNVSGHRVAPANRYAGVMMSTADPRTDYSLRMHPVSTGWDNGFEELIEQSNTYTGQVETIVFNKDVLGAPNFDFGVRKLWTGSITDYSMRHVGSQALAPGDAVTLNWTDQDNLAIVAFTFNVLELGPFGVEIDAMWSPTEGFPELELFWMDPATETLLPATATPLATTDADGHAALELSVPSSGEYALVLFRDERIGEPGIPQAVTIEISTSTVPQPDLTVFRDNQFFDLPMIPSFEPLPGPKAGLPPELIGGGATYFNFALENLGPVAAANVEVFMDLDGVPQQQFYWAPVGNVSAFSAVEHFGTVPVVVPGGRHTVVMEIDQLNQISERNETNNQFAMQFGWAGDELTVGTGYTRSAPPDPEAGRDHFELITTQDGYGGEQPFAVPVNAWDVNSDGMRIPPPSPRTTGGSWMVVGTMPSLNSDVNVRIHEVLPPVRAFTSPLASSNWGPAASDFVAVDCNAAGAQAWDVSVVNAGGGDPYELTYLLSQDLGTAVPGSNLFGQFGIDGPGFLKLYEIQLDPGSYKVDLEALSNDADLGLTVLFPTQPPASPFRSKDDESDLQPTSWNQPPGVLERVQFEVRHGEEGTFGIVVWKVGAADLPANQDYNLEVFFVPAAPECIAVDGTADPAYGYARAVQEVQTGFGDSNLGQVDEANGSELDMAFATVCDGTLYLTFTGNLESNYNDLEIFLDTREGGMDRLIEDPAFDGLARMGGNDSVQGFTFDPGFEPDWWFSVQGGTGGAVSGVTYRLIAYQAELLKYQAGTVRMLGMTGGGSRGILGGPEADNPSGIRVAIDNSNVAGVGPGSGADSGAGAITGIELAIPLNEIGSPPGCLRMMAFINGAEHDYVSNQFLPALPAGTGNLAEPRDVDLGAIPGDQYVSVCWNGQTSTDDEVPAPLQAGLVLHRARPNPFNPRTTLGFTLPAATDVEVTLFDLAGRRVKSLVPRTRFESGLHEMVWDGTDDGGRRVSSGAYLVRLTADGETRVRRVMLLK